MIVRMIDSEQTCGTNVEETVSLRQRCTQATIRFGNTARELLCLWDTTGIDNKEWVPPDWNGDRESFLSFVPFRDTLLGCPKLPMTLAKCHMTKKAMSSVTITPVSICSGLSLVSIPKTKSH